jgi:alpha/beta superfamily hydrolase
MTEDEWLFLPLPEDHVYIVFCSRHSLAPLVFSPVAPTSRRAYLRPCPSQSLQLCKSAEDPRRVAFVESKTRDEKMVKNYQEEIDAQLVVVCGLHHLFNLGLIRLSAASGRTCERR